MGPAKGRRVHVLTAGHSRVADGDRDAYVDEPRLDDPVQLGEFKDEEWWGCALPNLLVDGYACKTIKFDHDAECWNVTMVRAPDGVRQWAFTEFEDGEGRPLVGDPLRYTHEYGRRARAYQQADGFTEVRRVRGEDSGHSIWLVVCQKEWAG